MIRLPSVIQRSKIEELHHVNINFKLHLMTYQNLAVKFSETYIYKYIKNPFCICQLHFLGSLL